MKMASSLEVNPFSAQIVLGAGNARRANGNGRLTADDAKAAERLMWSRVPSNRERSMLNGVPDGASVDPQRYSELESFIAQACLALRYQGILFLDGSARTVLAAPRQESGRVGPLRPVNKMPEGEIIELSFGRGHNAIAARQSDRRWMLLQGSDVRPETVASANASTRYLRSA